MLYADARGVFRVYAMHGRLPVTGETSTDGTTWDYDFDVTYTMQD